MRTLLLKLDYEDALLMGAAFYVATILVHLGILNNIIPLTWINGGMSSSLQVQLPISVLNLLLSFVGLVFIQYAHLEPRSTIKYSIATCLSVLWILGLIMQLMGTPFEKIIMTIILTLGVISHMRIAVD